MGASFSHVDGLKPLQREAARLDSMGVAAVEIARKIGVDPATISVWRGTPLYQDHLQELMREQDRDAIRQARRIRNAAVKVMGGSLSEAAKSIQASQAGEIRLTAHEISALGKVALDIYRATSAQTGLTETNRIEVDDAIQADTDLATMLLAIGAEVIDAEEE